VIGPVVSHDAIVVYHSPLLDRKMYQGPMISAGLVVDVGNVSRLPGDGLYRWILVKRDHYQPSDRDV